MKKNGRSYFKIKSLNKEKIFNKLSKKFSIFNIKHYDGFTEFEVNEKESVNVEKFLLENQTKVLYIKHNGIKYNILKFFKMWGIVAGIIVGILCCLIQSFFVWKVEVWGCEKQTETQIVEFIENNYSDKYKNNIDTKKIEIAIKNNFENISSVSVAIVGQSLIINVNEAVLPEEMEGEFSPLISEYDGLIKSIDLVQGTLNVDVGDIVKKGDILVFPYVIDGDGKQMEVQPKAEIKAEIWIESNDIFYEYEIKEVRTGRKLECSTISLFGLDIYTNISDNQFETYEVEEYSQYISKNNLLPFIYTKFTFYETKTIEIIRNFEEEKDEVIEKLRQNSLIYLSGNEIIINENCMINESGGVYFISYIITVEKDIGEGYGYQFPQS